MAAKTMRILMAVLALACALSASAQAVSGAWKGTLRVMGAKLAIVMRFDDDGCTLDSPDQGAKGIPAELLYNDGDSVSVSCNMIGAAYRAKLVNGRLQGKFTQNGLALDLELEPGDVERARPQTPKPPFPYSTSELNFTCSDGAVIYGTLSMPAGDADAPIVVMVSGSGQQNRDEEIFDHKPFAVIADYLARNGIGSYRYDDRGVGKSEGLRSDLTTQDFMEDALCAIDMLRTAGHYGPLGILGHSEGGLIAYMIAGEHPEAVDFIVSLAGTAVKGEEILAKQLTLQSELAGQAITDKQLQSHISRMRLVPWYKFFLDYDPAPAIGKIQCPVFAANGTKDTQVLAVDNLEALRAVLPAKPCDKIKVYEGLNHLFQHANTGLSDEYATIEETISPALLDDIASWIKQVASEKN